MAREKLKKGMVICYRPNLVRVLRVSPQGVDIRGPYGEEQTIDWEDVEYYNRGMYFQEK